MRTNGKPQEKRAASRLWRGLALASALVLLAAASVAAQATTGTLRGYIRDQQNAVTPGATVTVRNVDTNAARTVTASDDGQYLITNLPVGSYELTVELSGFNKYVRSGLTLAVNQDAVVDVTMQTGQVAETVTVTSDASILNTTTTEVGVRFDTKRIAELPVINSRDVFSLALSAAGVSQLASGQSQFAAGTNFAVNGMRSRSNNFMIDGQDSNDPSVTGRQQPLNNTDIIQELRLVTNQFAAEYGRAAGSVLNVLTKSGSNTFRGSGFVFHQNNEFNARTNLDKNRGVESAPFFLETQYGGTVGGPIVKNRAFFFGGYQRWTQRFTGSGFTLNGAPTAAGRGILESAVGSLPQIQALLEHLPAADAPSGSSASFTRGGQTYTIPLGTLTGAYDGYLNNHQPTGRVDVTLSSNHSLSARYLNNIQDRLARVSRRHRPARRWSTRRISTRPTSGGRPCSRRG